MIIPSVKYYPVEWGDLLDHPDPLVNRLFPFYEGTAFHDYHHAKFTGNYAAFSAL